MQYPRQSTSLLLLFTSFAFLFQSHCSAQITLQGTNSHNYDGQSNPWDVTGALAIGSPGVGRMTVENGYRVESDDGIVGFGGNGFGEVFLNGFGTRWDAAQIQLGRFGRGFVTVRSGATLMATTAVSVGVATSESCRLSVFDPGSKLQTNQLRVANGGLVQFANQGDGFVDSVVIGQTSGNSTVLVDGIGSTLTCSGTSIIGGSGGNGLLSMSNGGRGSAIASQIGNQSNSGTLRLVEDGSMWETQIIEANSGSIDVGREATLRTDLAFVGVMQSRETSVSIAGSGGRFEVLSNVYIGGTDVNSKGNTTVDISSAGKLSVGGTMKVWETGVVNLNGGELDVQTLDLSDLQATGAFNFDAGVLAVDTVVGTLTQNGGAVTIGDSPGMMMVDGDLMQLAGAIEYELGGLGQGLDYDFIDLTGQALVNGVVDVDLIFGFAPELGDSFQLLDAAGGIAGTPQFNFFDAELGQGLRWDTSSFLTSGSISVVGVPEPSSFGLLLVTVLAIPFRKRWKQGSADSR